MNSVNNGVDVIIGVQESMVEVDATAGLHYVFEGFFDNTTRELFTAAAVGLIAEASTSAVGLNLTTPIATGNGADVIIGSATASTTVFATASVSVVGLIEAMNNSDIHSTVVASAFARAVASATAIGINNAGWVATGNGDDLIVGEATANGIAEAVASAAADVFTAADGTGTIDSSVFTNLLSTTDVYATAIGIRGGAYDLGSGNDTIVARATGVGVNIGVQDVLINGGNGQDVFDLQSGTGKIMGGHGHDLLILEGAIADYSFTEFDLTLGVTIQNSLNNTNLWVSEVEEFQFAGDAGLTYQYTDLALA